MINRIGFWGYLRIQLCEKPKKSWILVLIQARILSPRSKYLIIILHNYYPKPEYLIIGCFGPLGLL